MCAVPITGEFFTSTKDKNGNKRFAITDINRPWMVLFHSTQCSFCVPYLKMFDKIQNDPTYSVGKAAVSRNHNAVVSSMGTKTPLEIVPQVMIFQHGVCVAVYQEDGELDFEGFAREVLRAGLPAVAPAHAGQGNPGNPAKPANTRNGLPVPLCGRYKDSRCFLVG